ncbi:DNA polymerase [Micractinium conductrix]|uniref:DNA polymerase n=1 Tax=Micractinium conductrix TaxID=554055 RepID=A0A2P6UZX1_9CHLO|nr:DNA polymerase [Micractinium conductrix]|eukprot:PSC67397.1 DNA polymerase [Micractinium conductrix]
MAPQRILLKPDVAVAAVALLLAVGAAAEELAPGPPPPAAPPALQASTCPGVLFGPAAATVTTYYDHTIEGVFRPALNNSLPLYVTCSSYGLGATPAATNWRMQITLCGATSCAVSVGWQPAYPACGSSQGPSCTAAAIGDAEYNEFQHVTYYSVDVPNAWAGYDTYYSARCFYLCDALDPDNTATPRTDGMSLVVAAPMGGWKNKGPTCCPKLFTTLGCPPVTKFPTESPPDFTLGNLNGYTCAQMTKLANAAGGGYGKLRRGLSSYLLNLANGAANNNCTCLKAAQQLIGDYDIYSNANQNGRCPTDGACPIIGKRDSDIDVYASCLFLQWTDGCTVQDCNNV